MTWRKKNDWEGYKDFLLNTDIGSEFYTRWDYKTRTNVGPENAPRLIREQVNKLERGLDTMVGENGIRISGGERQRVGIARALYLNPQILVLDEITSSLDLKTENNLIEDLNNLKGQKTILIITHRLSTLKYCDEIFKIENKQLFKIKNENI